MLEFEWDPAKAASNLRKHAVGFELAATVFLDPFVQSIRDEDHSELEERWITMGRARDGRLLVVSHTDIRMSGAKTPVRLISARPATRSERRQFESGE